MTDLAGMGRFLIAAGLVVVVVGLLLVIAPQVPGLDRLGRLPGDIFVQRGNTTIFIPVVTSIVLSVALTIILNLFIRR
jgi:hypothetical protein